MASFVASRSRDVNISYHFIVLCHSNVQYIEERHTCPILGREPRNRRIPCGNEAEKRRRGEESALGAELERGGGRREGREEGRQLSPESLSQRISIAGAVATQDFTFIVFPAARPPAAGSIDRSVVYLARSLTTASASAAPPTHEINGDL